MAAAGHISSEFNRLRDASWLATGYMLGLCAVQPMVSVAVQIRRSGTDWTIPVRQIERHLRSQTSSVGIVLSICSRLHYKVYLSSPSSKETVILTDSSGIGSQMWVVILGRAISGMGGGGCMTISSVIITGKKDSELLGVMELELSRLLLDIVPKREVATWRAYVNISMTLGRSIGGPLGGWLSDTIGWRW